MSGNVRIKEEPADFECSPFEILNELAAGDQYGDHYGDGSEDHVIIKHETQVEVKTEITIGAQYDEDCAVLETPRDHDSTSRDHDSTSRDISYHDNAPTVSLAEEPVTYPANLSLKMELPAKYKTLFDGVKAFPEMSKEILPILEELVHFHNCICLLRRDLNMIRCEDCGRGFVTPHRVKLHARHCVVQKLENRFAPANITKHTGPSLETEALSKETETETEPISTETETETISKETSKESESCPNTTSRDDVHPDYIPDREIKVEPGLSCWEAADPVSGGIMTDRQSPQSTKRRRTRRVKEDREFEKGTCWGVNTKTEACKIPKVVELNQFNHKMINPYHLFRYTGEVLYHSPMPLPINVNCSGTAYNVFDTMISSIVEVGRLVPVTKDRRKYIQILQKQKRDPLQDLELLPTPKKKKSQSISSLKPSPSYTIMQKRSSKAKKIKIVCPSLPAVNPDDFLQRPPPLPSHVTNIGSRRTKMFNQSTGPIKKKTSPGLHYEIFQKDTGKSLCFDTRQSHVIGLRGKEKATNAMIIGENMVQKGTFDFEPPTIGEPSSAGNYNSDAQSAYLKFKLRGYMQEDFFETKYCLEEHTILFLKHFMGNTFENTLPVRQRADKILKALQDTIPDDTIKAAAIKETRSKLASIIDEENYKKLYKLDLNTVQLMGNFAFGVANPCQRDVNEAMAILSMIEIQKLRKQLHAEVTRQGTGVFQRFNLDTRILLEEFVWRVKPDKVSYNVLQKIKHSLQLIQCSPLKLRSSATNSDKDTQSELSSSSNRTRTSSSEDQPRRPTREILLSDSINESELSSPEIMRSCNEDVITVAHISIQSSDLLKCPEVLELDEDDDADTFKQDKEGSDKVVAVEAVEEVTSTAVNDDPDKDNNITSSSSLNDDTDESTATVVLKQGRRFVTEILTNTKFSSKIFEKDLHSLREFVCYTVTPTGGNERAMKMYEAVADVLQKYNIKPYEILGHLYNRYDKRQRDCQPKSDPQNKTHMQPLSKAEDQSETCGPASISELQRFMIHFLTNPRFCKKLTSMSVKDRLYLKIFINHTATGHACAMEMYETICAILLRYGIEPGESSLNAGDSHSTADSNTKPTYHGHLRPGTVMSYENDHSAVEYVLVANLRRVITKCLMNPKFCAELNRDKRTFLKNFVNNNIGWADKGYHYALQIFLTVSDKLDGDRFKSMEEPTASETPHPSDKTDSSSDKSSTLEDKVSSGPKDKVSSAPKDMVFSGPRDGVSSEPRDGVSSGPKDRVSSGPRDGVSSEPRDGISSGVKDMVSSGPKDGISSGPKDMVSSGPRDGVSSEPRDGVSSGPKDRVSSGPIDGVFSGPKDKVSSGPKDRVSNGPKDGISSEPRVGVSSESSEPTTLTTKFKYPMFIVRKPSNDDLKRLQSARKSIYHTNPMRLPSPGAVDIVKTNPPESGTIASLKPIINLDTPFEYNEVDADSLLPPPPPASFAVLSRTNLKGKVCDIHTLQRNSGVHTSCTRDRLELVHPCFTAFGPFATLCVGHIRRFMEVRTMGPVKMTIHDDKTNRLFNHCRELTRKCKFRKQAKLPRATQTDENPEQHVDAVGVNRETLDNLNLRVIIDENTHARAKIESLQQQHDKLKVKLSDMEQQLGAERELRRFLKTEVDRLTEANKQISTKAASDYEKELEKLRKENQELRLQLAESPATQLADDNTKLRAEVALLQTSNSSLQQNLDKKSDAIKSLEVSIQSISEALRHQTKTISALSRKHYDNLVDDHNHRIYSGYESLVTITCKILGDQLEVNEIEIEDPAKMREICESVAGDENLFSIFMRVFCGNSVCADETETAAIEKRVMFLINLMSYFYGGAGENEPSGSNLQRLL